MGLTDEGFVFSSGLQYMHLLTQWSNISSGDFSLGVLKPSFGVEMVFKAAHMSSETCFKELFVEVHGQTLSIHFLSLLLVSFMWTSLSLVMFLGIEQLSSRDTRDRNECSQTEMRKNLWGRSHSQGRKVCPTCSWQTPCEPPAALWSASGMWTLNTPVVLLQNDSTAY